MFDYEENDVNLMTLLVTRYQMKLTLLGDFGPNYMINIPNEGIYVLKNGI